MRLVHIAQDSEPAEAVGLLGGRPTRNGVRLRLFPLDAVTTPTGFRVSLHELAIVRRAIRGHGLLLAGCFHTHPSARATPSAIDRMSMVRFPLWWLIYSVRSRRATIVRSRVGLLEKGRLQLG